MKITDVHVFKLQNPKSKVVAFASVTLDDILVVKGFRVVRGSEGLFVGMPSRRGTDGKFRDDIFFVNAQDKNSPGAAFRNTLQNTILQAYSQNQQKPDFEDQTTNTSVVSDDGVPF